MIYQIIYKMYIRILLFVVIFISLSNGNPAIDSNDNTVHTITRNQLEEGFIRKLNIKCSQRDNHSCMMLKLVVYMNRIFKKSSIELGKNVEVTQSRETESQTYSEDDLMMARAAKTDDETLGIVIADKIWKFVRSRTLRYKLYDNADVVVAMEPKGNLNVGLSINPRETLVKGRGRIRNLGPIMAAIATKIGIVGALVFKGLILLTGKALIVSKIALLLAVVIGLKKFLSKKHVTYEVVAHPHHGHDAHHVHDSYSSGWARALDGFLDGFAGVPAQMLDAHDLAYAAQKQSTP